MPVHVLKRKARLKPATTGQFFFIASGRAVKIPRFRAAALDRVERMDRWLVDRAVDFKTLVSLTRALSAQTDG
jgi:hypothetical protein